MAVYVDKSKNQYRGMIMSHLLADTVDELHEFAQKLGLKREWFQPKSTPHYDVCQRVRKLAIQLGAIEIDRNKTVEIIRKFRAQSFT